MRLLLISIFILLTSGCGNKDCGSIDLSALSDIKLPVVVRTKATTIEGFMQELDVQMNYTHKQIIRCRSEEDFEKDNVLPGVMLWISDSWNLRNDTARLGLFFHQHGIDPWERARIAGILYHRHLNDLDLQAGTLLGDAQIRNEYQGRIRTADLLKKLDESQRKKLLALIKSGDSLINKINLRELSLSAADRKKMDLDKTAESRYRLMESLGRIIQNVQNGRDSKKDIQNLTDSASQKSFAGFKDLDPGHQLILIEGIRIQVLDREMEKLADVNKHR